MKDEGRVTKFSFLFNTTAAMESCDMFKEQ
jgi:hypothetical protein